MINVLSRLLAMHARMDGDGLVVLDGAFLNRVWAAEPPILRNLQLVLDLAEDEPGAHHIISVEALFDSDGEQVARVEGHFSIPEPTSVFVIPLSLQLRREGDYRVVVRIDGEEAARLPLHASFRLT